ncbi:MAG: hypothetical protein ACYCS1_05110 [Gammaproteobacteria bacterium]
MNNNEIIKEICNVLIPSGDGWHSWISFPEDMGNNFSWEHPANTNIGKYLNTIFNKLRASERHSPELEAIIKEPNSKVRRIMFNQWKKEI